MTRVPSATYRVQLTPAHGFAALAARAPYLKRLGVSHAYLSPILASAPGSQHGYDVVDHRRVDDELGGEEGFRRAVDALHAAGIGVLVDVVPNHMALTVPEHLNHVLWSVLRDGPDSAYARWLDVDWSLGEPLLLPVLGQPLADCLAAGEITVEEAGGGPGAARVLRYYEHVLPLRPGTEQLPLDELVAAQHYRLAHWRLADEQLNYRRFFDVDTLIAIRVEDPEVFDATHAVLVRLVREGLVDGLRIDHPDGLADPRGYLRRLRDQVGDAYVVVEKILEPGEELPADWPCAGTTGYDALLEVGNLFVDPAGGPVLEASFAQWSGSSLGWATVAEQSRRDVLGRSLVAEVERLAAVAHLACVEELGLRDHSIAGLTEAVRELLVAAPVYRAYVTPGEPADATARSVLDQAAAQATARRPGRDADIRLLHGLALGELGRGPRRDEFCVRFQQTTGPAIAKGVEDTATYRWFPLSGLGEVGGEPDRFGSSPQAFHAWAARRLATWPDAMTAMSTHDTKRSEDVRARLAALSEVPAEFARAAHDWRAAVDATAEPIDGRTGWLLWQTLVGAWPIDADRLSAYLVKAVREAKLLTSWSRPDGAYEEALAAYVRAALTDERTLAGVAAMVSRIEPAFAANVLGQRAAQLFVPGIPDIYQGCEAISLRLVDPDNRHAPDDAALAAALDAAQSSGVGPDLGAAKVRLTALGLRLRHERPAVFGAGASYRPLGSTGPAAEHVVGFVRGGEVAVVVTRLALGLAAAGGWRDTTLELPAGRWHALLTGETADGGSLEVDRLLAGSPVAVLVRG